MGYATVNPFTNQVVKTYPTATDDDITAAITQAHDTFLTWRGSPYEQRSTLLSRVAAILRERKTEFAKVLTLEMGKVLSEAEAEVELSAQIAEYYADYGAELLAPRVIPSKGYKPGDVELVSQPLGVLFTVEPWNFPYYQIVRVAAPQIFAGNTVLLKHASNVPQSAATFEAIMTEAGAPKGLFTNLYASHSQTELIINDPRVRGVALTGSEDAGAAIAALAAKALKKSTLELGGADAFVVLDDADVDKAADWAVLGRHWNAGQVCVSSKRLIVDASIYDRFVERYRAGVAALKAGDPLDPTTTLAPLSSQGAADQLAAQVKQAVEHGAHAETLGAPVPTTGAFFQPTILTDVKPDNPGYRQEFFGPVTQLFRVSGEKEAIRVANDSPYGLGGSVFTQDEQRGRRVAAEIDTGMVYINQPTKVAADIPFGGVKHSGYGHELIDLGIHEFVNQKVVAVADIDGEF